MYSRNYCIVNFKKKGSQHFLACCSISSTCDFCAKLNSSVCYRFYSYGYIELLTFADSTTGCYQGYEIIKFHICSYNAKSNPHRLLGGDFFIKHIVLMNNI